MPFCIHTCCERIIYRWEVWKADFLCICIQASSWECTSHVGTGWTNGIQENQCFAACEAIIRSGHASEWQGFGLLTLVLHSLIILSCVSFIFNYLSCCCLISKCKTIHFIINKLFHCKFQIFIWCKKFPKKNLKQHKAAHLKPALHYLDFFKAWFVIWKGSHVLPTQRENLYIYFICLKYFVLFPFLFPIFAF